MQEGELMTRARKGRKDGGSGRIEIYISSQGVKASKLEESDAKEYVSLTHRLFERLQSRICRLVDNKSGVDSGASAVNGSSSVLRQEHSQNRDSSPTWSSA